VAVVLVAASAAALGFVYWTSVPSGPSSPPAVAVPRTSAGAVSDPLRPLQVAAVLTGSTRLPTPQDYAVAGVIVTRRDPAGLVFHESALPRYPGLTLELRTTSAPLLRVTNVKPWPTGEGRMRRAGVVPVEGRRFWPHRTDGPVHVWSFPIVVIVHMHRRGCWNIGNVPISYMLGGRRFTHTLGAWQISTSGTNCPPDANSYRLANGAAGSSM
jgi:hypothetical protein